MKTTFHLIIFFPSVPKTIYEKFFFYANVVMINWLKNYIIFSIVYLGSLTGGIKNQYKTWNVIWLHTTKQLQL